MSKDIENLIKKSPDPKLTQAVFYFAENAYKERKRISEENYIYHAVRVASILNDMGLDQKTIDAALLHDVVDDMPVSAKKIHLDEIEKKFGREIAFMVERASELSKIHYSIEAKKGERSKLTEEKFENLKKMFFAEAKDLRVIIIELASRLDNLRYLNYLVPEQQKLYAFETLKIFVPIAERLSLWGIKSQLEDLSFSYLLPERFAWLKSYVKAEYEERDKYLKSFVKRLQKILRGERINVIDLNWRPKSYWSTYQKLQNHDMDIEKIHDLLALKIIVKDIESCYKTLGIIHKYFKPLSEDINDYIAKPKTNGYRSLHTTVFCDKDQITEIQIKTPEMQQEAEYGVCAHWAYKEKVDLMKDGEKLSLSKGIPNFLKTFKIDFYENKVFAFTPKGDVIVLPKFSTPVDFAYAIHSDIGNHCETAKINGKIASISEPLKNGDIVEIIINRKRRPSADWLKFVKSSLAASFIKKELVQPVSSFKISSFIKIPSILKRKVFEISEKFTEERKKKKEKVKELYVAGQKGILANMAKCCTPKPGDDVKAYLSKYRSVVIHQASCKDLQKLAQKSPDKIVEAHWEES